MDPNLIKIRDYNMRLIKKGNIRLPMLQARHYLTQILIEYKEAQINTEMKEFEDHIKTLIRKRKHHGQERPQETRGNS